MIPFAPITGLQSPVAHWDFMLKVFHDPYIHWPRACSNFLPHIEQLDQMGVT